MLNLNPYNQLKTLLSFLASSSVHRWGKSLDNTALYYSSFEGKNNLVKLFSEGRNKEGTLEKRNKPTLYTRKQNQ